MAVSKTISANGSKGHHKFTLVVKETATSTANNTSTVSITFTLSPVSTGWDWEDHSSVKGTVTVDGTSYSWACPTYNGSSTVTLVSKTKTITHGSDGTKSISLEFSVSSNTSYSYLPGTASASGTLALTAIPRYATSVQSLNSRTETSIKMNWSSDSTVDYIWYTTNGSASSPTWTGVNVADGKSGSYTISSLAANTKYTIKTRVRRKDSQLTTDSAALSVTTYSYPYAKTMPDFVIGSSVTITLENPLSRSCTVRLQKSSGTDFTHAITGTTTGTSITFTPTTDQIADMYANIRSASSATYYVRTTYGTNNTDKAGGQYSAASSSAPYISAVTYADTNSIVVAATGSNQNIVQGKSQVKITLPAANITLQNNPTGISSVRVFIDGRYYDMQLSGNAYVMQEACTIQGQGTVTAMVTVTDTRGLSGSYNLAITVYPYEEPTLNATVTRKNNFENDTIIAATATYRSVVIGGREKNSVTIKYQTKLTSAANYGSEQPYTSPQTTISLQNTNAYNVKLIARDSMGSVVYKEYTVPVGYPLIFFDTKNNSISVNSFPDQNNNAPVDTNANNNTPLGQFVLNGIDYRLTQYEYDLIAIKLGIKNASS